MKGTNCLSRSMEVLFLAAVISVLAPANTARAALFGIEFDDDDCIEKYDDKMRWAEQRRLMKDVCSIKHDGDSTRAEKRFAQCVLDSIFDVADNSNGRRVIQACSSKTGDEGSFRRFVGRFPMAPDTQDIDRRIQGSQPDVGRPITILGPNGPVICFQTGQLLHCP